MNSVRVWDLEDGDAQYMRGVSSDHFDFVSSSHCLEHLNNPLEGLSNWLRIIKPGGYLVILVPDEDLYEQGIFPSTYNADHKSTFTIHKERSWSAQSRNVLDLVRQLGPSAQVEKIELLTAGYRFDLPRYDQTMTPVAESAIEIIIRKASEIEARTGIRERTGEQPQSMIRRYYNQYRIDQETLKKNNPEHPPFMDESEL